MSASNSKIESEAQPLAGVRVLAAINGVELFGHERGNIEVFKALKAQGAIVRVGVTAIQDNHVKNELQSSGIETFPIPFGPQWSKKWIKKHPAMLFTNPLRVLRSSHAFATEARKFKPTHFHIGSALVYSYLFFAFVAHRQPLVYRMGDCPPLDSEFNLRLWKLAMRRTSYLVSISKFVQQQAEHNGSRKATVIYNLAPSSPLGGRSPPAIKHSRSKCKLLYVGAVAEHKGVAVLMRAMQALVRNNPNLTLDILGGSRYDAEYRAEMLTLVQELGLEEAVNFRGHVSHPETFYEDAALHIHPALVEEALGNVVMEAKRAGIPSVVFPSGGLPEMVRHQVDGYVCPEKTVGSLADAVEWMVADSRRLKQFGRSARQDYEKRFSSARFHKQWADLYLENGESKRNRHNAKTSDVATPH